jgi:phosphosulfolactate synthase
VVAKYERSKKHIPELVGRNTPLYDRWVSLTSDYLAALGVQDLPPRTSPFDPGYSPLEVASHLSQSAGLMATLKISMACWQVADETAVREKIRSARAAGVEVTTGGGPFEVAVAQRQLPRYLEVCAALGFQRIECGEGFTKTGIEPSATIEQAHQHGLTVQYEIGPKHEGPMTRSTIEEQLDRSARWLDAGAVQIVVEARESAVGVGLFDASGGLDPELAHAFADRFGLDALTFEAPTKSSQFAFLNLFGPLVGLSNVRLEELLRVEIYRRGLHSDAFSHANLAPARPSGEGLTE